MAQIPARPRFSDSGAHQTQYLLRDRQTQKAEWLDSKTRESVEIWAVEANMPGPPYRLWKFAICIGHSKRKVFTISHAGAGKLLYGAWNDGRNHGLVWKELLGTFPPRERIPFPFDCHISAETKNNVAWFLNCLNRLSIRPHFNKDVCNRLCNHVMTPRVPIMVRKTYAESKMQQQAGISPAEQASFRQMLSTWMTSFPSLATVSLASFPAGIDTDMVPEFALEPDFVIQWQPLARHTRIGSWLRTIAVRKALTTKFSIHAESMGLLTTITPLETNSDHHEVNLLPPDQHQVQDTFIFFGTTLFPAPPDDGTTPASDVPQVIWDQLVVAPEGTLARAFAPLVDASKPSGQHNGKANSHHSLPSSRETSPAASTPPSTSESSLSRMPTCTETSSSDDVRSRSTCSRENVSKGRLSKDSSSKNTSRGLTRSVTPSSRHSPSGSGASRSVDVVTISKEGKKVPRGNSQKRAREQTPSSRKG